MRILILSSLLLLTVAACTSKKIRKEVNQEVASAPVAKSDNELYSLENKMLMDSEHLSPAQRTNLSSLMLKMKTQNAAIDNEIMKTKAVLFQTLVEGENGKAKLNVLESQLLKLNRKKIRYSLSAYREARNIVGKSNMPLDQTLKMIDKTDRTINEY